MARCQSSQQQVIAAGQGLPCVASGLLLAFFCLTWQAANIRACNPCADAESTLELACPTFNTPVDAAPTTEGDAGRFAGNHYIKACSPAWLHEWVMIESLRF
jgi:hypothetical protein